MSEDPRTETVAGDGDASVDRADRWQERLAVPVIVAALASVPAIFLTLFDDPYATVGSTVNMISGGVLIAEAVVLFAVSQDRLTWLRNNLWLVALAAVMIPAVIFAVGPVQLLRLVRIFGALRIIRVRRIFKAGKILRQRAGLNRWWQRVIGFLISALVAAFVGMLLADPSSQSRQVLDEGIARFGWAGVVVAGLLLAGATWVVLRSRDEDEEGVEVGRETGDGSASDDASVSHPAEAHGVATGRDAATEAGRTNADVAAGDPREPDRGQPGPTG